MTNTRRNLSNRRRGYIANVDFRSSTILREIATLGMDANLQLSYKGRVDKNTEKHCQ